MFITCGLVHRVNAGNISLLNYFREKDCIEQDLKEVHATVIRREVTNFIKLICYLVLRFTTQSP